MPCHRITVSRLESISRRLFGTNNWVVSCFDWASCVTRYNLSFNIAKIGIGRGPCGLERPAVNGTDLVERVFQWLVLGLLQGKIQQAGPGFPATLVVFGELDGQIQRRRAVALDPLRGRLREPRNKLLQHHLVDDMVDAAFPGQQPSAAGVQELVWAITKGRPFSPSSSERKRWRCCSGLRPDPLEDGSFQVVVDQEGSGLAAAAPPTAPHRLAGGWGALASPFVATHMPPRSFRRGRGTPPGHPAAPSSVPACGWAGPGLLDSHRPEPPGPSSSGTARGPPAGSGRGHRISSPGLPSCPSALNDVLGGVPRATGWHPQMAIPMVRTWWQRRSGFLPRVSATSVTKFVGRKEAERVGSWRLRYVYLRQINSHRCALCVTRKHQLSRSSPRSLSVFVPTVSLWQLVRSSLHSVSLPELPFHSGFLSGLHANYRNQTQVILILHLTPLTYRCLLSLSPAADFAEPRHPRHTCVVTRAQARKFEEELDLSDSFMCSDLSDVKTGLDMDVQNVSFGPNVDIPFDRKHLIEAQKSDSTLTSCFTTVRDK